MKLYMKQKMWSLKQDFNVWDEQKRPVFRVSGSLFSFFRKIQILDAGTGRELALIKEKPTLFLKKMSIYMEGARVATIAQQLRWLSTGLTIDTLDWVVEGNWLDHDYVIKNKQGQELAFISRKWFSLSDSFEINILDQHASQVCLVAVVLTLDLIQDRKQAHNHNSPPSYH